MSDRDGRRKGQGRLFDVGSHSPDDVEGKCTYGSPIRVPPQGVDSTSFMPTPWYDPRSFFDRNQVSAHNQDASLQASHAGDTSEEGPDFQKLSSQNKENHISDPEGVGPSLHTCRAIPITEWHRHTEEHTKRRREYRTSQPSIDDSCQSPPPCECDILVQENLTSKGRIYGFAAEGVVMKRQSRLSVSCCSSSINNYDAHGMTTNLNESVSKAVEGTRQDEFRKQVVEEVWVKLIVEFNNQWAEKEAKIQNNLAQEKVRDEDEDDDEDDVDEMDTTDLGDDSHN
ncbi:hypothetical protein Cgig2_021379 [Carnegiea gigantea]|uniref:Uncharacterized protein n=1 Tax=Carnegiea gigantea TaxID=171969 RepID=A0A9Q1QHY3_9CARY|nr:hypothetical protein Cgig2_021379 [Carnegiea gigantea]